jgi:hypothetical protein
MLRKFAAALLATALIAGPAFAASPLGGPGSPATVNAPASTMLAKPAVKHATTVRHFRRHVVRHKVGKIKVARHFKSTKTPRQHIAAPVVKHTKFSKVGKVNKTSRINKTNRSTHS